MSWNFQKVGTLRDALKAAVQAESGCPQMVRDELCRRIDGAHVYAPPESVDPSSNELPKGQALYVDSHGHLNDDPAELWRGVDEVMLRVRVVPLIDTPL